MMHFSEMRIAEARAAGRAPDPADEALVMSRDSNKPRKKRRGYLSPPERAYQPKSAVDALACVFLSFFSTPRGEP
jgi:hypothetical protein